MVDISQYNGDIVQLRRLSISHLDRKKQDLQRSIKHGIEDVMALLLKEKEDLKIESEETRNSIRLTAAKDIKCLEERFHQQSRTLAEQQSLAEMPNADQEVEDIIALLSSNMRSIKSKIADRTKEMSSSLRHSEAYLSSRLADIDSRAAVCRATISGEVEQQVARLQRQLVLERELLGMEEACFHSHNSSSSSSTSENSDCPITPVTYLSEEERGVLQEAGSGGGTAGGSNGRIFNNPLSGYSESDSDSDS